MKTNEQPSTPTGKKRTMSPAARKKISDAQKRRHAAQGDQTENQVRQPANFSAQLRGLIATTRGLTREQLIQQVEGCIGPITTIGDQADRHAVRILVEALDQATAQRTMHAGSTMDT